MVCMTEITGPLIGYNAEFLFTGELRVSLSIGFWHTINVMNDNSEYFFNCLTNPQ